MFDKDRELGLCVVAGAFSGKGGGREGGRKGQMLVDDDGGDGRRLDQVEGEAGHRNPHDRHNNNMQTLLIMRKKCLSCVRGKQGRDGLGEGGRREGGREGGAAGVIGWVDDEAWQGRRKARGRGRSENARHTTRSQAWPY